MDSIKKRLGRIFILGCLVGSLTSCNEEEDRAPLSGEQTVQVQLDVHTRAADASDGKPTDEESALHTLRIYAFSDVDGNSTTVGHLYLNEEDLKNTTTNSFLMDLKIKTKPVEQILRFYAVANETAMRTQGSGAPAQLSATTSESQLKAYWFTELQDVTTYGLPMYAGKKEVTINPNDITSQTQVGHEGHYTLKGKVDFELQRPVGKLGVFAAKPQGETGELRITGLTMLSSGTLTRNYLMPQTDETLKNITSIVGDFELKVVGDAVTAELANNITDEQRKDPKNYTPVLNAPYYPFENPWGSNTWNVPGDEKGNVLQIEYEYDGAARTGLVYLPPIERNRYYTVCCLMHNNGKITVECTVAGWEDGGITDLGEFDYPSYTNPITPVDGTSLPESGKYPQPTVHYNQDENSDAGSYWFEFKIWAPAGKNEVWKPVLYTRNPQNFAVEVYQGGQKVPTVNGSYPTSSEPYRIRVKALKNEYLTSAQDGTQVNKTVGLGIAYTPALLPNENRLLLINGRTGSLKWEGSELAETIVIKQVDIPQN